MDGIHDVGGMLGFGPVEHDPDPPYERWEWTVLAIQRDAFGRTMNLDEFRHGIERMDPAHYLSSTYYEHWLDGMSRVLIEKGFISAQELDRRTERFAQGEQATAGDSTAGVAAAAVPLPDRPRWVARAAEAPPRFSPGDSVRTVSAHPRGHTRLPRYARGRLGVIDAVRGVHVFPDAHAHGLGEQPRPLYSVRFAAGELWGAAGDPHQTIYLDLWEPYLLPAGG